MPTIFIIHGAYGNPEENWFPWLKRELEKKGHNVVVPQFPTPEGQNLESWMNIFVQYRDQLTEDSVFVGHSIGCAFILNILERDKIKATYLVAGFTGLLGLEVDEINKTISDKALNWEVIKKNCPSFTVFHSDNDPYVRLEKGEELASNLNTRVTLVHGAGHFNQSVGYLEFPQLLQRIIADIES